MIAPLLKYITDTQIYNLFPINLQSNALYKIIADSGASYTVFADKELLINYQPCQEMMFTTASGHKVFSHGKGNYPIQLGNTTIEMEAYHLPDLHINLLSVNDFCKHNIEIIFDEQYWYALYNNEKHILGYKDTSTNLYFIDSTLNNESTINLWDQDSNSTTKHTNIFSITDDEQTDVEQHIVDLTKPLTLYDYHILTNHMSLHKLTEFIQNGHGSATLKDKESIDKIKNCRHCKMVRSKKVPHNNSTQRRAERRLQRIHSDLMGPFRIDGMKYYTTTLIDEFSSYTTIIVSDTRSVQIAIMREIKKWNSKFPGERIANFRADNAREMPNADILADEGITKEIIPAYTPAMNGLAESHNRQLLLQIQLIILNHPGYYKRILHFFPEIVEWAVYTRNHTPTDRVKGSEGKTPYELMYNHSFTPKFQQFGIDVLVHITCTEEASTFGVTLSKTRPATIPGFIIGYGSDSNTYLIQTIGSKPVRKYTANITPLASMNHIKKYLNELDQLQLEEANDISTQLDNYATNDPHEDAPPHENDIPTAEDFQLYKQLVDETGITQVTDFFDYPSTYINTTMLQQLTREHRKSNTDTSKNSCISSSVDGHHQLNSSTSDIIKSNELLSNRKDWHLDLDNLDVFMSSKRINSLCSDESFTDRGELQSIEPRISPAIDDFEIQEIELVDNGIYRPRNKTKKPNAHTAKALLKIPMAYENLQKLLQNPKYNLQQVILNGAHEILNIQVSNKLTKEKRWKGTGRISKVPNNILGMDNIVEYPAPKHPMTNINIAEEIQDYHEHIYAVERYVDMNDKNWREAMDIEMQKFKQMNVYDVVDIPEGKKLIPAKWVHTYKVDSLKGQSYKSRCVIQGFRQLAGIDFDPSRILSPVADLMTIRVLTVISCELDLEIHHIDITAAYLNASLPKEQPIYVKPPPGVDVGKGKCWLLRKSVYGLKQSGYEWFIHLSHKLDQLGLEKCLHHEGLYKLQNEKGIIFVTVYVDDLFVAASLNELFNEFHDQLENEFKLNYLGHIREYLGVEFTKIAGGYKLNQRGFTDELVKAFDLQDVYGRDLPRPSSSGEHDHNKISSPEDEFYEQVELEKLDEKGIKVFQKGVGMLQWLTMNTRPDISFAVNALGIKASNPTTYDYKMLIHCIEYVKKHADTGLTYTKGRTEYLGQDFVVYAYADASFAPPDNRKSVSGYCTYLNGNLVYWGTKKQRCVTTSTMASEIVALGEAVSRSAQVISILKSLNLQHKKLLVFEDNEPTVKIVKNQKVLGRRRAIDICLRLLRELVISANELDITYINTNHNLADSFTKALGIKKFATLKKPILGDGNLQLISQDIVSRLYGQTRDNSAIYKLLWQQKVDWRVINFIMGFEEEELATKNSGSENDDESMTLVLEIPNYESQ